jgi:hypothetical protein
LGLAISDRSGLSTWEHTVNKSGKGVSEDWLSRADIGSSSIHVGYRDELVLLHCLQALLGALEREVL